MKHINQKRLSAYLDGELNAQTRKEIESHLEVCKSCRELAEEIIAVNESLEVFEGCEPDPDFFTHVRRKLSDRQPVKWWSRIMVPVFASVATAASIVMGVLLGEAVYAGFNQANNNVTSQETAYLDIPAQDYPDGSLGEVFEDLIGGY